MAKELLRLRVVRLYEKKIDRDYGYLLPQLAAVYYAGQYGLSVITDTEEPVGFPIMALIPAIGLAIDVCNINRVRFIMEYICKAHSITYIGLEGRSN